MIRLVLFVEEESAKVLLKGILPRFGLPIEPRIFFNGKADLLPKVGDKMRRYVDEPGIEPRFLVMQDNDGADCATIKARLAALCEASGRKYRVRIVIQEMEAWMLGDLTAVTKAYPDQRIEGESRRARYRDPDRLPNPSDALQELTGDGRKIGRALLVAPLMEISTNASHSFKVFCEGVRSLTETHDLG